MPSFKVQNVREMTKESGPVPSFRSDINGLRAWAVSGVVLYHFGIPGFRGGFAGVDVFFVISGFLMTGIVLNGLERGGAGFSLWAFYMARARRILPALIVLCVILLMIRWWALLPPDYKMLGTHTASSISFRSNLRFFREAGYFDAASHEKWLLHTWSLSVEWQFYLLLPLVLMAVWKLRPGRRPVAVVMIAGLAVSFVLSILKTQEQSAAAFYFLSTRAWEMLAGGLAFLVTTKLRLSTLHRSVMEAVGLLLIFGTVVGLNASSSWPGWLALVPVFGTVSVLISARSNSRWIGNPIIQWMGTNSYSLYLWHWPIVVALTYLGWQTDPKAIAAGLVLTLAFGSLSYQLVETPSRVQLSKLQAGWSAAILLSSVVAVSVLSKWIRSMDGVSGRFPASVEQVAIEGNNKNPRQRECFTQGGIQSPSCIYGGNRLRAILLGDSHADAVMSALAAALPSKADSIMDWSYVSCPTLLGVKNMPGMFRPEEKCSAFLNWAVQELKHVPKNVPLVVVNRTTTYAIRDDDKPLVYFSRPYANPEPAFLVEFAQHITDTACKLAKDHPVYLIRPIPEMSEDVPKAMSRALAFGLHKEVFITLEQYRRRHAFVWAAQDEARDHCGVKILDPLPYLCSDGRCYGTKNGRPIYYDDNHLSEYGNKLLVPMFAKVFE